MSALDTLGVAFGFSVGNLVRVTNDRSRYSGALGRIGCFVGTEENPRAVVLLGPSSPLIRLVDLSREV